MRGLFGSKKKKKAEPTVEDPTETMMKINKQVDNIDKRQKLLEGRVKSLTQEALKQKKSKNTRGIISLHSSPSYLIKYTIFLSCD
jgi:hypothetical protein